MPSENLAQRRDLTRQHLPPNRGEASDAVPERVGAGEDRTRRNRRERGLRVGRLEASTPRRELVDRGAGRARSTVATEVIGARRIEENEEQVRPPPRRLAAGRENDDQKKDRGKPMRMSRGHGAVREILEIIMIPRAAHGEPGERWPLAVFTTLGVSGRLLREMVNGTNFPDFDQLG